MISRGIFYIVTMTAILLLLGFVTNFFCIIFNIDIRDNNFIGLLVLFALIGFGGSLISLYLSKYTVKKLKTEVLHDQWTLHSNRAADRSEYCPFCLWCTRGRRLVLAGYIP